MNFGITANIMINEQVVLVAREKVGEYLSLSPTLNVKETYLMCLPG